MKQIVLNIWKDDRGQDLIEYALMAGFVAVAAGAIMPQVSHEYQPDLLEGLVCHDSRQQ